MAGMANAATKEIKSPKSEEEVTAEDVRRSREPWHGFDGADERDDPYANLRYAFKTDSLKGKGRVSIGEGASGEAAVQIEQMPPTGPEEPINPMQLPTRVLPAQDAQIDYTGHRRSASQGPSAGQEGLHLTSTREQSEGPRVLEELAAKCHQPAPQSSKCQLLAFGETARAGSSPRSTRTVSSVSRPTHSEPPPPALLQLMSPPPRHLASQRFDHRADPAPASAQTEAFARRAFGAKKQPAPREYAPGLAMRKRKADPYDPPGPVIPKQPFSMVRSEAEPSVRGSWTSFDTSKNVLNFDKRWHAAQSEDTSAIDGGSTPPAPDRKVDGSGEPSDEKLDGKFENPDLDVDEDIRKEFRPVSDLMTEQPASASLQDRRNPFLRPSATSAPLTVVIGGRIAKVLKPKADRRAESLDRFGNYIGKDLGLMKKHLIEDRQTKIKLRDEEMVEATRQKRMFESLDAGQRELALGERRAPLSFITGGQGAASADVFEDSDIPEIYLRSVAESALGRSDPPPNWNIPESSHETPMILSGEDMDAWDSNGELSHRLTPVSGTSDSTVRATGANAAAIGRTRRTRGRKISTMSSTDPSSPSLVYGDPELAPIEDVEGVPGEFVVEDDEAKADVWGDLYKLSSIRGRVVSVTLHDPVQFTPGAVMDRVFGGIIQEVQFHPKERIALIAFLFPAEAEDFVKHVKTTKENNHQEYRRLQIDADWYKGSEHFAIYPFRYQISLGVIGEGAGRVLGINGVSLHKKKEDVNQELNGCLRKLLVKVGLITPIKRYVQERDGKMAIIQFASIKDAIEAKRLFEAGLVHGYEGCSVQWLKDPCDKPAIGQPWCNCNSCAPVE
ncbi:MAG: hypothetical protein M1839_009009 [Geoglossum umbratile]|nr:MAG: hypothetical protein M1839_009009 [Geoglossum umbratile]